MSEDFPFVDDDREPSHSTATTGEFLITFAIIAAAIVAFLVLDMALARVDARERRAVAAGIYEEGRALLASGDAHEAHDRFATALAMERSSTAYALGVAQASVADGRVEDAEETLRDLITRAETDGVVNLTLARVLVLEHRIDEAKSYFHRAIYGRWDADSLQRRLEARLELVDLLASRHDEQELLAELLPLEAEAGGSDALRRRLGHLFVHAGAPARGVELLRPLLRDNPRDADAYGGLGDAALALGNFRTARADYLEATRLLPTDTRLAGRLALADSAHSANPLTPGIGPVARLARSRALLARTTAWLTGCARTRPSALADSARVRLSMAPPAALADAELEAERTVALAGELWSTRHASCRAPAANNELLAILFAKLAE